MINKIIEEGIELAERLEEKLAEYYVKSDAHETCALEAVGIRTRIKDLKEGNIDARQDTRYKDIEWGSKLHKYCPKLSGEVRSFYQEYYEK